MKKIIEKIKKEAMERVMSNNDGNPDFILYIDHQVRGKGESLDIVTDKLRFKKPTYVLFVDDEPGKNFGHRCHYLLFDAKSGEFEKKVRANFPYFLDKTPETLEVAHSCPEVERFARKKKLRIKLDPAKLSAYRKLAPFPLKFWIKGRRYAILFSGSSNGRHVNDMEFMYRTLVDVYGYDSQDIFVLNYDGTINYNRAVWSSGWTEPPATSGFGPDGSAWRMSADSRIVGPGTRAGFQGVINSIKSHIRPWDCLLIHTNNHGWYDSSGGFLSAYVGGRFYASDLSSDLSTLPSFKTLLVVMEQCASGSFGSPIMAHTPAKRTVFQAAVPGNQSSAGGWPFDPWAEMWISAMAGVRGDGTALVVSPDDNLDSLISSWEAYDYAIAIDNPVMSESSPGLSRNVYLCRCRTTLKPVKEWKEHKEIKEPKEVKELKEPKEHFEPKQIFEPKMLKEPKQIVEGKEFAETKEVAETPEIPGLFEQYRSQYEELDERMERMEEILQDIKPFIGSEKRPELRPGKRGKEEE